MAGKGFDFFRMAEEAMRVIEEVADAASAMSDDAEKPRGKRDEPRSTGSSGGASKSQSSRPSSGERRNRRDTDGLGGAAGLAGLAALGIAAYAQQRAYKGTKAGRKASADKKQRDLSNMKKAAFKKNLIAAFDRECEAASRDRSHGYQRHEKYLSQKERAILPREAFLSISPSQEKLVDPAEAKLFFGPILTAVADARPEAISRAERMIPTIAKSWLEYEPEDTEFERHLHQRLKIWLARDDSKQDRFLQRIEKLEATLERIRAAVERGKAEAAATAADTRYLSIPAALELTAPKLEELSKRVSQPRDKTLAALFDDLMEGRIDAKALEKALDAFDWTGAAVADILERAILLSCVRNRLGFNLPDQASKIGRFGEIANRAVMNLPPEEVDLSGEDAARIATALIADFEREVSHPRLNIITWAIIAPVTAQMLDRLKDYFTRDEAQALFKRLEAAAIREMDEGRRKRGHTRIFAPYAELLQALAEAAQVTRPVAALAKWDALLASRAAARDDILSTASAFWQPLLSDILDAERADHRKRGELETKAYSLINRAGAFDDAQQEMLAAEVEELLQRPGSIRLASRDDGWLTNVARHAGGDNIAISSFERLQSALALDPRDRRAYFAPPTDLVNLGEFAKLLDAQKSQHGGNAIIEGDIGDLLNSGQVEEGERQLRDWIEKSPDGSLRDAVLATGLDDLELSGWKGFASLTALDEVGAISADFSAHCVYNLIDCGESDLPLEAGGMDAGCFDFAATPLEEIRKIGRTYGTPWQGSCRPMVHFDINGLAPVLRALHALDQVTRPTLTPEQKRLDDAVVQLAETWCFAAFAVKVHQAMQANPLPRKKPVILGTHDFGTRIPEVIF